MDYLPIFVGVTAAAVVIQAGILVGLYVAVRKTSSRMEALATEVKDKVMPTADTAHAMLVDLRPKIETIATNVSESTTVIRGEDRAPRRFRQRCRRPHSPASDSRR